MAMAIYIYDWLHGICVRVCAVQLPVLDYVKSRARAQSKDFSNDEQAARVWLPSKTKKKKKKGKIKNKTEQYVFMTTEDGIPLPYFITFIPMCCKFVL